MIFKKDMRQTILLILGLICFYLTGCSSKNIMVEPKVKYGNPLKDHVKDIPKVRYQEQSGSKEKKNLTDINADEYERSGDEMLANGKYFLAFMQYEHSLEKNKANLRVEYKKGVALLGGRKNKEARQVFQSIIKKNKGFALAHQGVGRVNLYKRFYGLAKRDFEKAVELDPLLWRSYGYIGNLYDLQKENALAVNQYKIALLIKPDAGFIHNNMGVSLYKSGRNKEAVNSFYQALKFRYDSNKVYNNIGRAFAGLKLYDKAFAAFKKGGSQAVAYNNLGVGYLNNGEINIAVVCFETAIELSPSFYVLANENLKKCRLKKEKKNSKGE